MTESTFIERKSYNYSANTQSPGEIKSREVELKLGSHSWMGCLAAESFLSSCFSDTVFVTLFRAAVEAAVSEVHKLFRTGWIPASVTLLYWRCLLMLNNNNGNL